jgi:hypothetical protein
MENERDWEYYSTIVYMEKNKVKAKICKTESDHLEFMLELTFDSTNEKLYKAHWFYGNTTPQFQSSAWS